MLLCWLLIAVTMSERSSSWETLGSVTIISSLSSSTRCIANPGEGRAQGDHRNRAVRCVVWGIAMPSGAQENDGDRR